MIARIVVLTLAITALACGLALTQSSSIGNLGYNSYEGYLSGGSGLNNYFGPGVGYPSESGDFFRRYFPPEQWGRFGYGTGHLGMGYGPYIYDTGNANAPGLNDPLPEPYWDAGPPSIKVSKGRVRVAIPSKVPGIRCVTVTLLAFNGAELCCQSKSQAPWVFDLPVMDGLKNVRVRIDYANNGLSATSYPI